MNRRKLENEGGDKIPMWAIMITFLSICSASWWPSAQVTVEDTERRDECSFYALSLSLSLVFSSLSCDVFQLSLPLKRFRVRERTT